MDGSDEGKHLLSTRDESFRRAVEHSQAGYFYIDEHGLYRWVNAAWLRMHGLTDIAQVLGRHFSAFQVSEDLAAAEAGVQRVMEGRLVAAGDFTRRMADGSIGYHTFTAQRVVLDGVVKGIEGLLIDKTAYHQLEEQHRLLFTQMLDGFAVLTPVTGESGSVEDFRYDEANPSLARLLVRPQEEIPGSTLRATFSGSAPLLVDAGAEVLRSGVPASLELHLAEPERIVEVQLSRAGGGRLALMMRDRTKRVRAETALRDNESLLLEAQELAGLGSYVLDIPGNSWTSSEVLDRVFGIGPNYPRTLEGWIALVHPGHQEMARDHFVNEVLRDRKRFDLEYRIVRGNDGQVRWVHGLGEMKYGPGGEPLRMIGTIQDISDRKEHEEDQAHSVAILRLLNTATDLDALLHRVTSYLGALMGVESAAVRIWENGEFRYLRAMGLPDSWMCPRAGVAPGEPECLCGLVLTCDDRDRIAPCVRRHLTADGSFWTNRSDADFGARDGACAAIVLKDGCPLPAFQSLALLPMRFGGRTLGLIQLGDRRPDRIAERRIPLLERMVASLAIAVEQRVVQAALRENEERYRMISENTGDVIWLYDLDEQRFTYMSPSSRRFSGLPVEEAMSRTLRQTLSPMSYEFTMRKLQARIAAVESGDLSAVHASDELEHVRMDGTLVDTEVVTTLLKNTHGRVNRVLGVSRDITERKQVEARLMQAQKMESVGRLAGGVAHDFNNQLTVINGYSQLVLSSIPEDSPMRPHIQQIYAAGERAASLTRQLLAFSRKQMMNLQPLNLNQVVLTLQPMLTRLVGEDVDVRVTPHSGTAVVSADLHQIEQVVMNLAVNARDAMPGGGLLEIGVSACEWSEADAAEQSDARPGWYVRLQVRDSGVGMDEATRMRIFEPFFTTKEVGKGTGLGLSMVQGVVSQCGGFIVVRSAPGTGTTFEIHLPMVATGSGERLSGAPGSVPTGHESVLVVEDQPSVRDFAVQVLTGYGYKVVGAASASEALELVRSCPGCFDLLVTDVVMPEIDGVELAERLRRQHADLKCLYMSGYSGSAINERRPDGSLGHFIQKPFSPEQLAVKVRAALGDRSDAGEPPKAG